MSIFNILNRAWQFMLRQKLLGSGSRLEYPSSAKTSYKQLGRFLTMLEYVEILQAGVEPIYSQPFRLSESYLGKYFSILLQSLQEINFVKTFSESKEKKTQSPLLL